MEIKSLPNNSLTQLLSDYYLSYSSYTILSRAVPYITDGLKPVQRRILHAMDYLDDGRYNKVANITGTTMAKFHPHGDCLAGETIVLCADGIKRTMYDIYTSGVNNIDIFAYDTKSNKFKITKAHSFRVGQITNKIYNIKFVNGFSIRCTGNHPFLTKFGWKTAESLSDTDVIISTNIFNNTHGYPGFSLTGQSQHQCYYENIQKNYTVHHKDENKSNNSIENLQLLSRAEHALVHKDYIKGFDAGRNQMFDVNGKWYKETKEKNSELMKAFNKVQGYYKALKVIEIIESNNLTVSEKTYEQFRLDVYNAPRLDYATKSGKIYTLSELLNIKNNNIKLIDTEKSKYKTNRYDVKKKTKRAPQDVYSTMISNISDIIADILEKYGSKLKISKDIYSDIKANYPKSYRTFEYCASNLISGFYEDSNGYKHSYIDTIACEELCNNIEMYDFTVDNYENMIIYGGTDVKGNDIGVVTHNSSIYGALISLGQKNLLIDTQGNWGNIYTGDNAAAGRYIEARLTKFAKEVVFNEDTTEFVSNYDGRSKEPVSLPVKFPLLLALGTQGIANGYSTEILPHNAKELCESAIQYLSGKPYELLPDFQTGGIADISDYQNGKRGGKVKVRAKIKVTDKNTVTITEIPYSTTTQSIMDSIIKAADKDKIKIKKVEDNTSEKVEINVIAAPGTDLDTLIGALYTFTDCEVTISPMCTVIKDNVIYTCSVNDVFEYSIEHTKKLLEWELQNKLDKINDNIWKLLCEMVFVSTKTYEKLTKDIKSYEDAMTIIRDNLSKSFNSLKKGEYSFIPFIRDITEEDCKRLYEMPIRRLAFYEISETTSKINSLIEEHTNTVNSKKDMTKITISWFKSILKKYSETWNRKTEFSVFTKIEAAQVALTNIKLYADIEKGFIGTSMKSEKYMCDVSDIDDILVICKSGTSMVTKVQPKVFVENDIIYVNRIMKTDTTVFTIVYEVEGIEKTMVKRFTYGGYTRDKKIPLLKDIPNAKIIYLHVGDDKTDHTINVTLLPKKKLKFKDLAFNIKDFSISGRASLGVMFTKYPIEKIV